MSELKTVEDHLTLARVYLLDVGGVDNWEWYSDSLNDADYEEVDDELEDAQNLLNALDNGGVDKWTWYDESLTGLSEYQDYLEDLEKTGKLDEAEHISAWKAQYEAQEQAKLEAVIEAKRVEAIAAAGREAAKRRVPGGPSEEWLYAYIAEKYGDARALDIFENAIQNGLWKRNTFPTEFKQVMKSRGAAVGPAFLEESRKSMLAKLEKNGKLANFLDEAAN